MFFLYRTSNLKNKIFAYSSCVWDNISEPHCCLREINSFMWQLHVITAVAAASSPWQLQLAVDAECSEWNKSSFWMLLPIADTCASPGLTVTLRAWKLRLYWRRRSFLGRAEEDTNPYSFHINALVHLAWVQHFIKQVQLHFTLSCSIVCSSNWKENNGVMSQIKLKRKRLHLEEFKLFAQTLARPAAQFNDCTEPSPLPVIWQCCEACGSALPWGGEWWERWEYSKIHELDLTF